MDAAGIRRRPHWLARCVVAALPALTAVAMPIPALAASAAPAGPGAVAPAAAAGSVTVVPVVAAAPAVRATQIVAGDNHGCLRRGPAVSCWGSDSQGQLGDGAGIDRPYLVPVNVGGDATTRIAAGGDRTCTLSRTGAIACWGGADGRSPVTVDTSALSGVSLTALAVGADASCALSAGGAVFCWSAGNGMPAPVGLGAAATTSITAGRSHACALSSAGTVSCWATGGQPAPVDLRGIAEVDAGGDRTCALTGAGAVFCWGGGAPARVDLHGIRPTRLAVGGDHTCALAAGRAYCWSASGSAPVAVPAPVAVRLADLAAGYAHTCGVSTAGVAYCWGGNGHGQLGDRTTTGRATPVAVRGPAVPPGAPTGVTGRSGDGVIDVAWTAPASLGSGGRARYTATASPGGHGCRSSGATRCRIAGLANGTAYTLTVVAGTSDGTSAASGPSAEVTPYTRPLPPAEVQMAPGDRSLSVSWTAPDLAGTGTLSGYTATLSPGGATCVARVGNGCTVTGLANGTTYTVTVVTVASAGASVASNPSGAATPGAPDLPSGAPAADDTLASSAGDAFAASGTTTLTGGGFAPATPVVVGVYPAGPAASTPETLRLVSSDDSGNLTADLSVPENLRGSYTLVARGCSPGGGTRTLALSITVAGPAAAAGGRLLTAVSALGVVLFVAGLVLLVLGLRGRLPAGPAAEEVAVR